MRRRCRGILSVLLVPAIACCAVLSPDRARAERELTAARVKDAIRAAQQFLIRVQNPEGSYGFGAGPAGGHASGATSLAMLALLTSGVGPDDAAVARGLRFLRHSPDPQFAYATYQLSLMLMTFSAAHQWDTDRIRMASIASQLEDFQMKDGATSGMWNYGKNVASEDNSNTQFAVLGLREAAVAGIKISRQTWERTLEHFIKTQNDDGGWGYQINLHSTGSMTCAGIGSLVICEQMLGTLENDTNADGSPKCCSRNPRTNEALRRALQWLARYFAVGSNPGEQGGRWALYYLYGVERAGRLSGQRFFGNHDWYREGAAYLLDRQLRRDGSWSTSSGVEADPLVATSFALLFLSKGLAPVLINKLNYASQPPDNWNLHPSDARNLTEYVSGLPKWPKLLTYQEVDLDKVISHGSVRDLLQAPILYLSGLDEPKFTEPQIQLLKAYVEQGGFIFAVDNCNGAGFEDGVRSLVSRIYPSDAQLKRLPPEHPIYRAEFPLDPEGTELLGVDFGCRTSFVYSPRDHSCLWDKWTLQPAPQRTAAFSLLVLKAMKVGANVVAYATGREPYDKLDAPPEEKAGPQDQIKRGLLQVAKLRHTGDWDAAPRALHNVLLALNELGVLASTQQKNLVPNDPQLRRYPLAYLHGRASFEFGPEEIKNLRKYLDNGAVLFADSCCGSPQFDKSFREMVQQLFPNKKLERIPITHELFSPGIGFDIRRVKRRIPENGNPNGPLDPSFKDGEPFLEGIELNGRYCVIYSKYDLSCALERQTSVSCAGYIHRDAVKIAVNVIRYALLQDLSYANKLK
jgi:prenyltransferase beta subunit